MFWRSRIIALWPGLTAAVILIAMAVNLLTAIDSKSITNDETALIPAGYYQLAKGNTQLLREQPPLPKIISALPLLALNVHTIDERSQAGTLSSLPYPEPVVFARFWEDNLASFETISFWARVPAILLTVVLGGLIFAFALELFGATAGVLAVALFSLEPTLLGHGRVAGTDVPAAFGYLLLMYFLTRYLSGPNWGRAGLLGIAGGVACVTKFSMLLAGLVLATTFLVMVWRAPREGESLLTWPARARSPLGIWPLLRFGPRRSIIAGHAAIAALSCIAVINAAYFFHHTPLDDSDLSLLQLAFPNHPWFSEVIAAFLSNFFPSDFLMGALFQFGHNTSGHPASLLGMHSYTGWRYYFPLAFALKVPLSFLFLSIVSLCWCGYMILANHDRRCFLLLAAFLFYFTICVAANINIGIRYILPAYPFLFILSGAVLDLLIRSQIARPVGLAIAAGLLILMAVETVRTYPDYIPYMNQLTAGRPHWQYLSDSNVEWGDDARGLAEYLRVRGETRVQAALLGAYWPLHFYDITYIDLNLDPIADPLPRANYVAIGASFLNGSSVPKEVGEKTLTETERVNLYDAYRKRSPTAIIGGSIYVFKNDK